MSTADNMLYAPLVENDSLWTRYGYVIFVPDLLEYEGPRWIDGVPVILIAIETSFLHAAPEVDT